MKHLFDTDLVFLVCLEKTTCRKTIIAITLSSAVAILFAGLFVWTYNYGHEQCVTKEQIDAHQSAWVDTLLKIGELGPPTDERCADISKFTRESLARLYGFGGSTVLFNPTLTYGEYLFRNSLDLAESYFIGRCAKNRVDNETGFAFAPTNGSIETWRGYERVESREATYLTGGKGDNFCKTPVVQERFVLFSKDGAVVSVDKTFVYRMENGKVELAVHHSSLKFNPNS